MLKMQHLHKQNNVLFFCISLILIACTMNKLLRIKNHNKKEGRKQFHIFNIHSFILYEYFWFYCCCQQDKTTNNPSDNKLIHFMSAINAHVKHLMSCPFYSDRLPCLPRDGVAMPHYTTYLEQEWWSFFRFYMYQC